MGRVRPEEVIRACACFFVTALGLCAQPPAAAGKNDRVIRVNVRLVRMLVT